MQATKSFRELIVWQKSMRLVLLVYRETKGYPRDELYGLTSQTRRAVIALPSNIAEGYARRHTKEYAQFINIAIGSGAELETQVEIANSLGYLDQKHTTEIQGLLREVMRMLNKLLSVLRS